MFTVVVTFYLMYQQTEYLSQIVCWEGGLNYNYIFFFFGGGDKEKGMGAIYGLKTPKMSLISEYLAADLFPDVSADAPARINIG